MEIHEILLFIACEIMAIRAIIALSKKMGIPKNSVKLSCTYESVHNRDVSVLAVLETFGAMIFAGWLVLIHGYWSNIAVAACIAVPFLLLRTERSDALTRTLWEFWLKKTIYRPESAILSLWSTPADQHPKQQTEEEFSFGFGCLMVPVVLIIYPVFLLLAAAILILRTLFAYISATVCKFIAITYSFLCNPLKTICSIPKNWAMIVLCVDSGYPPEMVPGLELYREDLPAAKHFTVSANYEAIETFEKRGGPSDVGEGCLFSIIYLVYLPALLYRYALKATAIVWLPLLWVSHVTCSSHSLETRLRIVCRDSLGRFVFWFSILIVVLLFSKLYLYNVVFQYESTIDHWPVVSSLVDYVEPYRLPWWQVAAGMNSIIAIGLFFYAGRQLLFLEGGATHAKRAIYTDRILRSATFIRAVLSVYTIISLFYLVALKVSQWTLPPLGKMFPWSN